MRRRRAWLYWSCASLGLLFSTGVRAEAAFIDFTSFLREGPGLAFRPIDELLSGSEVDVLSCADGWCRVSQQGGIGFVAKSVLRNTPMVTPTLTESTCFATRQAGFAGGREIEICYRRGS